MTLPSAIAHWIRRLFGRPVPALQPVPIPVPKPRTRRR